MVDREFPLDLLHALGDLGVEHHSEAAMITRVSTALEPEIRGTSTGRGWRLWPRNARPTLGLIVPALSVVITIAVAVTAISLLSHHPAGVPHGTEAPRSVAARFAVLRRPQTSSDRLPRRVSRQVTAQDGGRVLAGATRLIATQSGTLVFLVVLAPGHTSSSSSLAWSPRLGDQLALIATGDGRSNISRSVPASVITNASDLTFISTSVGQQHPQGLVAIAPDGVARLRIAATENGHVLGSRTASVTDNAAVIAGEVASLTKSQADQFLQFSVTWYSPTGTVIPTSNTALQHATTAAHLTQRAQLIRQAQHDRYRAPAGFLEHFAVFSITSRAGQKTPSGFVISHPLVSSLPLAALSNLFTDGSQVDPTQIRQIVTPTGATFWVVPTSTGLCLAVARHQPDSPGGAADCSSSQRAAQAGGVGLSSTATNGTTIYGIVPTSTHSVTIRTGTHTYRNIHPHDGVYGAHTPFHYG